MLMATMASRSPLSLMLVLLAPLPIMIAANLIVSVPLTPWDFGPYEVDGGACRTDLDCAPGAHCERAGPFPDGTCTLQCRDHFDCPRGTACVDVHGGVCLIACGGDLHCRDRYHCKARDDRGGDRGESMVCIR